MKIIIAALAAAALAVAGTAWAEDIEVVEESYPPHEVDKHEGDGMTPALSEKAQELPAGTKVAVLEVDAGTIEIQLFPDEAPATAANFINLVEDGFYDGITFHRVVPDFVIQAGDASLIGRENPDITLVTEGDARKCVRGAISMARGYNQMTKEYLDTSPTQFFILKKDSPHLDPDFCVFGEVVTGMDAVDKTAQGDTIKSAVVVTVGED